MHKIMMIVGLFFSLLSLSAFSAGDNVANAKIKLYTLHSTPYWVGIESDVDISLVINDQLIIAKNHPGSTPGDSYVEVESTLNYQEISQAKFSYLHGGKKYQCVAADLPLYVQEGPIFTGTTIYFNCM